MTQRTFLRLHALAAGTTLTAFLAGLAAVPTPWHDPFVWMIWIRITILGAVFGFAYASFLLWETRLTVTIPIVMLVSIVVSFLAVQLVGLLSPAVVFVAGLATMSWCRRTFALPASDTGAVWTPRRS